jgi:hypothetical protein
VGGADERILRARAVYASWQESAKAHVPFHMVPMLRHQSGAAMARHPLRSAGVDSGGQAKAIRHSGPAQHPLAGRPPLTARPRPHVRPAWRTAAVRAGGPQVPARHPPRRQRRSTGRSAVGWSVPEGGQPGGTEARFFAALRMTIGGTLLSRPMNAVRETGCAFRKQAAETPTGGG